MTLKKYEVLKDINFGNQVAENETERLSEYFLETSSWTKIQSGEVDIIYGAKGTGKSAIYVLIQKHEDQLRKKGVILVPAEEVRGDPVFLQLKNDVPTDEREFENLWKLYFLSLVGRTLDQEKIDNIEANTVTKFLKESGLLPNQSMTLEGILGVVRDYIRRLIRPKAAEMTINPSGQVGLKISFEEPNSEAIQLGHVSVNSLLDQSNQALKISKKKIWLLIDRLDVAFDDSSDLEKSALRSLFKAYKTLRKYERIELKIFLRTDVWSRISEHGFREATHLSRNLTLSWDTPGLQNLILRRLLSNDSIIKSYKVNKKDLLKSADEQKRLFYKIFPPQVEAGKRQSSTMDWLIKRTSDAKGKSTPRDIVTFLNALQDRQLQRFERGESQPTDEYLFDAASFKQALPALSEYRTVQVLYSEYPDIKDSLEALRGKKAEHDINSLMEIWCSGKSETTSKTNQLIDIGFFQKRQAGTNVTFWVPFIYRPYLGLVMGRAQ